MTMGEPAGVGPEITVKAWCARTATGQLPWIYLGDPDLLRTASSTLGEDIQVCEIEDAADATDTWHVAIPVLKVETSEAVKPGAPTKTNAAATVSAIDLAVDLARSGEVSGIVTNPIQKSVLYEAGFAFPGHTEYLAHLSGATTGAVMMLVAGSLRTVPVTIHIPLSEVFEALSTGLIVATVTTVARDLSSRFAVERPRIAVSGLNPHAGESGALGCEETEIIAPAIAHLREAGIDAFGPLPADTMFHAAARKNYDAAVCMYHDQALIPVKTVGFDTGVNCTLGLPFIRTSPDHGTALDIAGTGKAHADSLIASIKLAQELASNVRERHEHA